MLLHRVVNKVASDSPDPVSLRRLLATEAVATHFQPIFSVRQKSIVGLEALSRGTAANGRLIPPYELFKMAAAEQLHAELENLCRKTAVRSFSELGSRSDELLLFLNLDIAATDDHEELPATLATLVRAANLLPRNTAVEFLESRLEDVGRFGALADA